MKFLILTHLAILFILYRIFSIHTIYRKQRHNDLIQLNVCFILLEQKQEILFKLFQSHVPTKPLLVSKQYNEVVNLLSLIPEIQSIKQQYPTLTELDTCILSLLAIHYSNAEIIALLNMSKRTYYKRRQLLASKLDIKAAELDNLAHQLLIYIR